MIAELSPPADSGQCPLLPKASSGRCIEANVHRQVRTKHFIALGRGLIARGTGWDGDEVRRPRRRENALGWNVITSHRRRRTAIRAHAGGFCVHSWPTSSLLSPKRGGNQARERSREKHRLSQISQDGVGGEIRSISALTFWVRGAVPRVLLNPMVSPISVFDSDPLP